MTLDEVLRSVERSYGKDSVQNGVQLKDVERLVLPTRDINRVLYGGLPFGRLIEFSGAEHSGKTTTAMISIGAHQKYRPKRRCVFIDAEGTYDPLWASKLGVDNSKLIKLTPENQTAEECLQTALDIAESDEAGIIVLDSIPALVPQQEDAKNLSEYTMAGISKPLTVFARKMQRLLIKYPKTMVIAINQLRDNMSGYGQPTTTIGGRMWKHSCSIRLEFRGYNTDDTGKLLTAGADNPAGAMIQCALIKNKTAPRDHKLGKYFVTFQNGFDEKRDVINAALEREIVQKAGASVRFVDKETGEIIYKAQGMSNFMEGMTDAVYNSIVEALEEADV